MGGHHMKNKTILQGFEWDLPADATHWQTIQKKAKELHDLGFTAVWLPPAYKASSGIKDVGYGVYDHYDLGEFDQKDTVPTKYGTKDEYLQAIQALHENELEVYADIVFNHLMGADETETVPAVQYNTENRTEAVSGEEKLKHGQNLRILVEKVRTTIMFGRGKIFLVLIMMHVPKNTQFIILPIKVGMKKSIKKMAISTI